jgi:hypothetical protein
MKPAPEDDVPVPVELAASWQQAETAAYSTVTERPDLYERTLLLVRRTADHLRLLGQGTGPLLSAADRGHQVVAAVAEDSGIAPGDLDLDLVARAALALRYREVRAERMAAGRLRRLEEGRSVGRARVVAEESGDADGDPFLPYTRLDVDVATGKAVLVTTTPDDDFHGVVHSVRAVHLDPATGSVVPDPDDPEPRVYPDARSRDEAAGHRLDRAGQGVDSDLDHGECFP